MTYENKITQFDKEHIYVVEIDLDYCSLTFGAGACVGGKRSVITQSISVDDFSIGDEIEGGTSGAVATVEGYFGASPTKTMQYRVTNGIDFQTATETITNNTATGVAIKNGNAPILVTSGDGKCFNTFSNCQDLTNFTNSPKTYRFSTDRSPHPVGINAIPSLESINISPAKIDVTGGMGERSSVSLTFRDHPHSDIDVDQYVTERTWIASDRGLFWTKLRARNPNYQFRALRVLTGYLEDGKFIANNFKTRNYVIDKMDVTNGKCSITAKDPLKLASAKKAQVPAPSTGTLAANITAGVGTATLSPAGIGNSEYAVSGHIAIGSEVMSFTRAADVLTITRAQKGTTADAHSLGDAVQECYVSNAEVNVIIKDILTNYASVDAAFINDAAWQTEVDTYLNGLLDGIITKPTDVNKVFKELSEAKPLFIYWDELNQTINLEALKAPPTTANVVDMDSGIVAGSFNTKDLPKLRASTVYVTFGQIDPTKPLTELSNYTQTVTRVDSNSITKFGNNQIKNIVSRWINSGNKPAASNAAQLLGRRFSDIPREVNFSLDAKDSSLLIGQTRSINHRDILDATGAPVNTVFQITSAKEDKTFKYTGVEYTYGQTVPGDEDIDTDIIEFSTDEQNVDLRARYETNIGVPTGSTEAVFKVLTGSVIGSSSTAANSIETGSWPAGATVTLINYGHIVGKGGDGKASATANDGGDAINMGFALTIENFGVIGGGGGGGTNLDETPFGFAFGAGGAGNSVGAAVNTPSSSDGTLESGGISTSAFGTDLSGGDLGQNAKQAAPNGGLAGKAVDINGFTLTYNALEDYRGAVS